MIHALSSSSPVPIADLIQRLQALPADFVCVSLQAYFEPADVAKSRSAALIEPSAEMSSLVRESRDEQIRRAFNGRNMRNVCEAFKVSRATVYRIAASKARRG